MSEEKKQKEKKLLVLNEVPSIPQREITDTEGNTYSVITRDEAIAEILETVRELKKGITG